MLTQLYDWFKINKLKTGISQHDNYEKNSPAYQIQTAQTLLKNPEYIQLIQQVKALISASAHQFEQYYMPPLSALAGAAQALPAYEAGAYQRTGGFLAQALQRTVYALKKRQSYLLPPGGKVEEQYLEQDIWTYAVYLAGLLQDCEIAAVGFELLDDEDKQIHLPWQQLSPEVGYRYQRIELPKLNDRVNLRLLLLGRWLPIEAMHWLSRFPRVKTDWLNAITESTSASIIADILVDIQVTAMAQPATVKTAVTSLAQEIPSAVNTDNAAQTTVEQIISVDNFLSWLEKFITVPEYPFNTLEGGIFQLEEGCLILYPTLFESFLKAHNSSCSTEALCRQMLDSPVAQSQALQHYCVGDWQTRTTVTGLLLKTEAVFKTAALPPIYHQAYKDE